MARLNDTNIIGPCWRALRSDGSGSRKGALNPYKPEAAARPAGAARVSNCEHLCPELKTVGFNGQVSGKFAPQFVRQGYRTIVLP
jgi:hypothetical protein